MRRFRIPLLAVSLLFAVSCSATVIPPTTVVDPATVVLVTHGKSSSLILPDEDQQSMTRWAFGDWRYYALGRTGPYASAAAVLWPTRGALGRQRIDPAPARLDELIAALGIGIDEAFPFEAERAAVEALRNRLQAMFDARQDTLVYNPEPRLEFVHAEPYTLFNSSNRKVAQWLRELGCTVSGVPLLSRWRVVSD